MSTTKFYKNKFNVHFDELKKYCSSMEDIESYIFTVGMNDTIPTEISENEMPLCSHFNGITNDGYNQKQLEFEMCWSEEIEDGEVGGNIDSQPIDFNFFEPVEVKNYGSNVELFWNNEKFNYLCDGVGLALYTNQGDFKDTFDNDVEARADWENDFYQTLTEQFKYIDLFSEDIVKECVQVVGIGVEAKICDWFNPPSAIKKRDKSKKKDMER